MTDPGKPMFPWIVVSPQGVEWLGHAKDEADAWCVTLGWPDATEIQEKKDAGWYATTAQVTWKIPANEGGGV